MVLFSKTTLATSACILMLLSPLLVGRTGGIPLLKDKNIATDRRLEDLAYQNGWFFAKADAEPIDEGSESPIPDSFYNIILGNREIRSHQSSSDLENRLSRFGDKSGGNIQAETAPLNRETLELLANTKLGQSKPALIEKLSKLMSERPDAYLPDDIASYLLRKTPRVGK